MCGIVGICSSTSIESKAFEQVKSACQKLAKRGPDAEGFKRFEQAAFGHRRLSIIDTSEAANQPFSDPSGRYTLVFNGEIYNYQILRKDLIEKGFVFSTKSDTEVLLYCFMQYGTSFLNKLNGFFALAIYDSDEKSTLIARDRFGIKPLIYYSTEDKLIFASEMKALLEFDIPREIDQTSLYTYLQLNYIPEPNSIFSEVKKLSPGHYLKIDANNKLQKIPFYLLDYPEQKKNYTKKSYEESQSEFLNLLENSVIERLVSDVPLGTFLSGGIDSSLITALASKHIPQLSTFSIGYKDEPHFDETNYALAVAKKYKTDHHVFSLGNAELFESLHDTLDYIDEPFADSSALAVNLLSKYTSKHVKVALSGDGADELFAGYYKHHGEFLSRRNGPKELLIQQLNPLWEMMPKSRNNAMGNLVRKLNKFALGAKLNSAERYWLWASLMGEADAAKLLIEKANPGAYQKRKEQILNLLKDSKDFNDVLATDLNLVLLSDMLRKVDLMSMSNGLEVRTPFLDHRLVNFSFSLPASMKINRKMKKRIVQDAARSLLPEELYNRPKMGFEVPLLKWFRGDLNDLIKNDLLSEKFIKDQNIFNANTVNQLLVKLDSNNPGDVQGNIWALLVFNHWWKRYLN